MILIVSPTTMDRIDMQLIPTGAVFENVPVQDFPAWAATDHKLFEVTGHIGCWCNPDVFAYSDENEDGLAAYWTVDHHYVQ